MGSKLARSACGTKRSVGAAARCDIAGVASPPAAATALAAAPDVRKALRSMTIVLLCAESNSLGDAPEEGQWSLDDPADVPAPSLILQEEPGWRIDDFLARCFVETADRSLLLVQRLCLVPGVDLDLDVGDCRPAEPRLVAVGADRGIRGRIDADRTRMPSVEHVPAALARRRFLRPAGRIRTPVDGIEIDVDPKSLQQIRRDVALRLRNLQILCHKARDRLTGITAFGKQPLRDIQAARAL